MPNPYFKFKQFTVYHDLCSMKVGIDGVLLGCWASHFEPTNILDIGTGSGLIALMLAQRYDSACIDAIDLEHNAILQATKNINCSPWQSRISASECSLQEFVHLTPNEYELIVSNPPYFVNSLSSPNAERTLARHTSKLTHYELLIHAKQLLSATGILSIILPVKEGIQIIETALSMGLYCNRRTTVYPKPKVEAKRLLLEFSCQRTDILESELYIETENRHEYSPEFVKMAAPFYLKL